jgi:hypothetical protein
LNMGDTNLGSLVTTARSPFWALTIIILLVSAVCDGTGWAQELSAPSEASAQQQTQPQPSAPEIQGEKSQANPAAPCLQPAQTARWQNYEGPGAKIVGIFGRRLERRSVHPPHYIPGAVLCTLDAKDKFILFVEDTVDPVTFLSAGFNAGIGQAEDTDPSYGQGAAGYGKRFGASIADQASSEFFKDFVYPTIFSEDPRYYRLAHGSGGKRFFHAVEHSVVAYRPDGTRVFNFSEWLGTASAVALTNTYHPNYKRGFAPSAERVGYAVGNDIGFDVLREFWPEIARKLKLPFRDQHEPVTAGPASGPTQVRGVAEP